MIKIPRLIPRERQTRVELLDIETKSDIFLNIYRTQSFDDINGYYIRTKDGGTLLIDKDLSPTLQAKVIKSATLGINKCPSTELAVINKDFSFICGGSCCFIA